MMEIGALIKKAHENAVEKGFWEDWERAEQLENIAINSLKIDKSNAIATRLMLIVSEALEGLRKDDIGNFKEELADVAIRLADLAGGLNIDLEEEINKKMNRNKNRKYKHGKKF